VVGADAMAGGFGSELGTLGRLVGGETAGFIGSLDKTVVIGAGNSEEIGHGNGLGVAEKQSGLVRQLKPGFVVLNCGMIWIS